MSNSSLRREHLPSIEDTAKRAQVCLSYHEDLIYALEQSQKELKAAGLTGGIYSHNEYLLKRIANEER